MDLANVILRPILTEKSYLASTNDQQKKYYFLVNKKANKFLIKAAFKAIYGVDSEKVNIIIRKPVATKTGTAHPGRTQKQKVAIITLAPGVEISITGEKPDEKKKDEKE